MPQIDEQEILRRRDMREVFTFTIDPADAKDFDDALSYQVLADAPHNKTYSRTVHKCNIRKV